MTRFIQFFIIFLILAPSYSFSQTDLDFTDISKGIKKAKIATTTIGEVSKYSFQVGAENADLVFWSGSKRGLFLMTGKNAEILCAWQDQTTNTVYLNNISTDLKSFKTIPIASLKDAKLVAVCADDKGAIYYLCVLDKSEGSVVVEMRKTDVTGKELLKKSYDCSKVGLDAWKHDKYMVDIEYSNGFIGMMFARRMFAGGDGLNHQGGIACIFNSSTLELVRNFGQTSGHSFDNYLTKSSDGKFLALDLGDNYPRGVNLHSFSEVSGLDDRIVFTYKTEHGTSPGYNSNYNYPKYTEISTDKQTYYKWSNDNSTYSELGGVSEVSDGYMVFFVSEPDVNGKTLNNGRAGSNSLDPRNIGMVKVRKDFDKASYSGRNEVSDDLILSEGITEEGGFYDFGGSWTKQRNKGVIWLTKYTDATKVDASSLKICALPNNETLLLWAYDYKTYAMKVNASGKIISAATDLGADVKLTRRDEILLVGNTVIIPIGNSNDNTLDLVTIEIK